MTLKIQDRDVENLLNEVVQLTGETRLEAIRQALDERRQRLAAQAGVPRTKESFLSFLQDEVWPQIPPQIRGVRLTKAEEETILGYKEHGV